MPVYEYQCSDCGRQFDIIATLAEKEAGLCPKCPKCGRARVSQVFSRFTLLTGSKSGESSGEDLDMSGGGPDLGGMGMDDFGDDDDYEDLGDSDDA
jgi:putative FmdB family regulatory protein